MFPALQILHPFSAYSMHRVECTVGLGSFPGSIGARHCCPRGTCGEEFSSCGNFIRQVPRGTTRWCLRKFRHLSLEPCIRGHLSISFKEESGFTKSAHVGKHPSDASSWPDHTLSQWGRRFGRRKSMLSPCMGLFRFFMQASLLHWSQFLWTEVPSSILKFILIYEA